MSVLDSVAAQARATSGNDINDFQSVWVRSSLSRCSSAPNDLAGPFTRVTPAQAKSIAEVTSFLDSLWSDSLSTIERANRIVEGFPMSLPSSGLVARIDGGGNRFGAPETVDGPVLVVVSSACSSLNFHVEFWVSHEGGIAFLNGMTNTTHDVRLSTALSTQRGHDVYVVSRNMAYIREYHGATFSTRSENAAEFTPSYA